MAVEKLYAVYLNEREWFVVSQALLIVDEERNADLGGEEDQVNRKVVERLERQGVMLHS